VEYGAFMRHLYN